METAGVVEELIPGTYRVVAVGVQVQKAGGLGGVGKCELRRPFDLNGVGNSVVFQLDLKQLAQGLQASLETELVCLDWSSDDNQAAAVVFHPLDEPGLLSVGQPGPVH